MSSFSLRRALISGVVFGFVVAFAPACSPPAPKCNPGNCMGCCDTSGACQPGGAATACGQRGSQCQVCILSQVCAAGLCSSTGTGGGATGGGATGGGATGGGATGGGATGGGATGGGATGGGATGGGATGGGAATGGGGGGATGGGATGGGATGGGATGGGATGGGAPGPNDVIGHAVLTRLFDDGGTSTSMPNFSTSTIGAWITEDGGQVFRAGVGSTTGTWVIPSVPQGPYILRFNSNYYVTSARDVDFNTTTIGRADAVPATINPTTISFALSGLSTWGTYDFLSLTSFNANSRDLSGFERYSSAAPLAGSTTWNATTNYFLYSNAYGTPMIDTTRGDSTFLYQNLYVIDGGVGYSTPVRGTSIPALAMADGQTSSVTAALVGLPTGMFTFDYRASDYAAAAVQLNQGASYFSARMYQTPHPRQTTTDAFAETTNWYAYSPEPPMTTVPFGQPLPSSWATSVFYSFGVVANRQVSTATAVTYYPSFSSMVPFATFATAPIQPVLGPPVTTRINGLDLLVDQNGVGLTPSLTWGAPTLGTPQRYRVVIDRVVNSGGVTRVAQRFSLDTNFTSLTVPSGVLTAGQSYVITLGAYSTGAPIDPAFLNFALPYHSTTVVSGLITP